MASSIAQIETIAKQMPTGSTRLNRRALHETTVGAAGVCKLTAHDEADVLRFLEARPVHTVFMASMVRDNGLDSPLNRGAFYGYRNSLGLLDAVALFGHATLLEARTGVAIDALAKFAREDAEAQKNPIRMILGEQEKTARFWNAYAKPGDEPRLVCSELLYEQRFPLDCSEAVPGLRPATLDDLVHVMQINATMAMEESGVNPMESDPLGYRMRTARRIEQGRVWVLVENGELIFKSDIIAETPEVIYLEGVYVRKEDRGKGMGLRCFSQLCRKLLARTVSICLLVNSENKAAQEFYRRAGYELRSHYDTIFMPR